MDLLLLRFTIISEKDALISAAALNQAVESLLEEAPEQYQWEYKRFKDARKGSRHTYGP